LGMKSDEARIISYRRTILWPSVFGRLNIQLLGGRLTDGEIVRYAFDDRDALQRLGQELPELRGEYAEPHHHCRWRGDCSDGQFTRLSLRRLSS